MIKWHGTILIYQCHHFATIISKVRCKYLGETGQRHTEHVILFKDQFSVTIVTLKYVQTEAHCSNSVLQACCAVYTQYILIFRSPGNPMNHI